MFSHTEQISVHTKRSVPHQLNAASTFTPTQPNSLVKPIIFHCDTDLTSAALHL